MRVSALNWRQMEALLEREVRCVLPIGSTEQHAGLSLATDSILAERVAVEAAEPEGVPVFPVLSYGVSPHFTAYPGTVSLTPATYVAVVGEILDNLARMGFQRILLVNGHGGNHPVEPYLEQWTAHRAGPVARIHNWWKAPRVSAHRARIDILGSHASWAENFPWTRVEGARVAEESAPEAPALVGMSPEEVRATLGEGNMGGLHQRADAEVLALWTTGVEETRDALRGPWGASPT